MERKFFAVTPLVHRAGTVGRVAVSPRFAHAADILRKITRLAGFRADGTCRDGVTIAGYAAFESLEFRLEADGALVFDYPFATESEYFFRLYQKSGDQEVPVLEFNAYALEPDWFALRPFKGDFHIHTNRSDGLESPDYVAAAGRAIGLDFCAITDHRQYQPSLDAIASQSAFQTAYRCYPGEEVHALDNPVHIVNFGGDASVNRMFQEDEAGYRREVAERAAALPGSLPEMVRFQTAASEWVFDRIRSAGGLALYCHPYWRPHGRYYIADAVNEAILARRNFDLLEVYGGHHRHETESNALSLARYQELRAAGARVAPAGVSDAHGCDRGELFGWFYTLVLARSTAFADLKTAMLRGDCLAVEALPGEFPHLAGDFRLIRYAYFLLREFYPEHNRLCREEGEAMQEFLAGDETARERAAGAARRLERYCGEVWSREHETR